MSQHPSLKSSDKMKQHRSVLKRYERLRILKEKGAWSEEESVFGLPKVKILKFKIKKEKAAVAGAEGEAGAALPGEGAAATPAGGASTPSSKAQVHDAKKPEAKKPKAKEAKPKK